MTDTEKSGKDRNQDTKAPSDPANEDRFPIVGVGASAGGLAAFEKFFSGMPADQDPGMAFVLVQHLAPDHKSILTDLIRKFTRMKVFEVEDGMRVRPNCTYIIPPNHNMAFVDGVLELLEPTETRGLRMPIDFFFRSMAQALHERAIGIVLSGTGSDGTLGVRAIKGEGGMVMAQTADSTEFDGMPSSAIATGMVDYQLPPAEMATNLIEYATHAYGKGPQHAASPPPLPDKALDQIFKLLRTRTGHDFSHYKPSTITRRIERRMAVHQISQVGDYVHYLRETPEEVDALFRDLLIGVTRFFRDTEAFEALEKEAIPELFENMDPNVPIRVWVVGCSTGEEAYTVAILLRERMEELKQSHVVQLFATDIDNRAIDTARNGVYPASIAADISAERLARYFTVESDGTAFRVQKVIREMMVFSEQDLIKDPPFSKLDLICCRNLLIYLDSELQKKIIPLFHYALNPGGMLFLGTSEGIGDFTELFSVMDRKAKLYARKGDFQEIRRSTLSRLIEPVASFHSNPPRTERQTASVAKLPLRELTERVLLKQIAPAAALVRASGDILYLHGRSGMFLEPAAGEAGVNNILKMARQGLLPALSMALHKAVEAKETVRRQNLSVKTNGHFALVNLTVRPVTGSPDESDEAPLYLVVMEEAPPPDPEQQADRHVTTVTDDAEACIAALQRELRAKEEYLQSTCELLESSSEELKSSNEEMQSMNEELQSSNEELETSKEELQSINEELSTVNAELQTKVSELSQANNDMNNLLAGTGIGTVFVDHRQRILRFTPAASEITNLIPTDVGRPVSHVVSNLVDYDRLATDVQSVLDALIPVEVEVRSRDGKSYTMRILPYRTLENMIEGVVITFFEITEMVRVRESLLESNEQLKRTMKRLTVVLKDANDAIAVQDLDGHILAWNPGAERIYGWTEAEALAMNALDRIPPDKREEDMTALTRLSQAEVLEPYVTRRLTKDGQTLTVTMISTALLNKDGETYAIASTERAAPT